MSGTDLGFTGTRSPLTEFQHKMLDAQLRAHRQLGYTRFHQGDCLGADYIATEIAHQLGYWIIAHPSDRPEWRAGGPADETRAPLPPLHRNGVIATESHAGLAVPVTDPDCPVLRSGTWTTIRRFRAAGIPHTIIGPTEMRMVTP